MAARYALTSRRELAALAKWPHRSNMKELAGSVVRGAGQPQPTPESLSSAEAVMQTDAPSKKAGGRLSRDDQRRLGDILQRMYDDVLRQGVPDRFRDLLSELEQEGRGAQPVPSPSSSSHGQEQSDSESDRLMGAQGLDNPDIKGPHR